MTLERPQLSWRERCPIPAKSRLQEPNTRDARAEVYRCRPRHESQTSILAGQSRSGSGEEIV